MTPRKAPPTNAPLETFYTVSEAAVRLGLRSPEEDGKRGEKWLRDGVNRQREADRFPCHRMAGQLMFSDTDLAEIAARSRNAPQGRTRHPRGRRTAAAA